MSDSFRAVLAVLGAFALAVAAVKAAPWLRQQGYLPTPEERLYTIINLTEDPEAFIACPLNEAAWRDQIEAQLAQNFVKGVFSPIADGPDVMTHELEARHSPEAGCEWHRHIRFMGETTRAAP